MNLRTTTLRLVVIALVAWTGSVFAAETKPAVPAAARDNAKKEAEAKANQQTLMEQAKKQAESFSKDHDAMLKQLNAATEEQKKAILDRMKEREKEFQDRLSALHKQMRDEQRKQRHSGGPGKR
jgi:hypothetical protein